MMTCQTSEAQELQPPLRSVLIIKRRGEMKRCSACSSDGYQESAEGTVICQNEGEERV